MGLGSCGAGADGKQGNGGKDCGLTGEGRAVGMVVDWRASLAG